MKRIELLLIPALVLLLSSCELGWLGVPSINSIYSTENVITKTGIEGVWYDKADSIEFVITYVDSIGYQVTANFDSSSVYYVAHLVNIEGQTFLDLSPDFYCDSWTTIIGNYGIHALPSHVFAKVSFKDDEINLAFMNYNKLEQILVEYPTIINHALIEDHYVGSLMEMKNDLKMLILTASIKELQDFVINNPDLFTNEETLIRAH